MQTKNLKVVAAFGLAIIFLLALSIYLQLELPAPAGPYPVGQTVLKWVDTSRPEELTDDPNDTREVITLLWYPAEKRTGTKMPYFPELSTVSKALVESGELESWQVSGLRFVRSHNLLDADLAKSDSPYPILIFSPGNATNIDFYNSLASEIASHGDIVVGLNHPYDVAVVELSNHKYVHLGYDNQSQSQTDRDRTVKLPLHVFEMPLVGYGGYLLFALELYALYHRVSGLLGDKTTDYLEIVPK